MHEMASGMALRAHLVFLIERLTRSHPWVNIRIRRYSFQAEAKEEAPSVHIRYYWQFEWSWLRVAVDKHKCEEFR